jgi:hypothetical protein
LNCALAVAFKAGGGDPAVKVGDEMFAPGDHLGRKTTEGAYVVVLE